MPSLKSSILLVKKGVSSSLPGGSVDDIGEKMVENEVFVECTSHLRKFLVVIYPQKILCFLFRYAYFLCKLLRKVGQCWWISGGKNF